jgi:adenylate kinase family enzyme
VPRLVLINGAPGSGKSTLASRYAQDHPLTLALDVDQAYADLLTRLSGCSSKPAV